MTTPTIRVSIHRPTAKNVTVKLLNTSVWFTLGDQIDVFCDSLETIRDIGHELIRLANVTQSELEANPF
jgi:hypothetical protein